MLRAALIAIVLFASSSANAEPEREQVKAMAIVRAACAFLDATLEIAKADTKSAEDATGEWQVQLSTNRCRIFRPRRVELSVLELSYVDYSGKETEVWKVRDIDFWVIVLTEHIRKTGHTI